LANAEGLLQFGNNFYCGQNSPGSLLAILGSTRQYCSPEKLGVTVGNTQQIVETLVDVTLDSLHGNTTGEHIHAICYVPIPGSALAIALAPSFSISR